AGGGDRRPVIAAGPRAGAARRGGKEAGAAQRRLALRGPATGRPERPPGDGQTRGGLGQYSPGVEGEGGAAGPISQTGDEERAREGQSLQWTNALREGVQQLPPPVRPGEHDRAG